MINKANIPKKINSLSVPIPITKEVTTKLPDKNPFRIPKVSVNLDGLYSILIVDYWIGIL
jgi:hypothetical protein